jgi:hypothetical protein
MCYLVAWMKPGVGSSGIAGGESATDIDQRYNHARRPAESRVPAVPSAQVAPDCASLAW